MLTANRVRSLLDALNTHWDPVEEFERFAASRPGQPRIWKNEDGGLIEVDMPGADADSIDVTIEGHQLLVSRKESQHGEADETGFRLRERNPESQSAEFEFPFALDGDLIDVTCQNGVVRIGIQKPAEEKRRRLEVRQG